MIQNLKIFLIIIIILAILVILGIGGFFTYKFFTYKYYTDMQERKSLEYELSKPSEISKLPNDIPIYPGARSTSYSVDSYSFIVKDFSANVIKYYTDYFSKNSQYSVSKKRWCGDAHAMFCALWVDTLTIKNNDGQNEFVTISISEYKTGSRFILTFPQSNQATDWKTYTDNKYGFEFKYPANTSANEDRSGGAFLSTWNIYTQNPDGSIKDLVVSFDLYSKDTVKSFGWENGRNIPNQTAVKNNNGDVMYITLENENYKDFYNLVISSFKFTNTDTESQTTNWKNYINEQYRFSLNYPSSLKIDAQGPNSAQQELNAGKSISGTAVPSYETLYFRDLTNRAKFQIDVFHVTDKTLTVDNYKNYFYNSGNCDLRYLEFQPELKMIQKDNISFIQVDVVGTANLPRTCFYTKNNTNNLIVTSMLAPESQADFQATEKMVEDVLSTFKLAK